MAMATEMTDAERDSELLNELVAAAIRYQASGMTGEYPEKLCAARARVAARLSAVPAAESGEWRDAMRGLLAVMEIQEKRQAEAFHVSGEVFAGLWSDAKAAARAALASPASGAAETAEGKTPGQEIAEQWAKRMIHRHGSTLGWLLDEEAELARDIEAALPSPPSPAPTGTAEAKAVAFWRVPDAAGWFFECADCGAVATEIDMFHKPGCPNVYVPDAPPTKKADAATPAQAYREGRAHGAEVAAVRAVVRPGRDAVLEEAAAAIKRYADDFHGGSHYEVGKFAGAMESLCRVRALKGQPSPAGGVEGGWVAVKDRVPDAGARVITFRWIAPECPSMDFANWEGGEWQNYNWHRSMPRDEIDYWREAPPLPPSPPAPTTDQQEQP
jgi:hypothetical protein